MTIRESLQAIIDKEGFPENYAEFAKEHAEGLGSTTDYIRKKLSEMANKGRISGLSEDERKIITDYRGMKDAAERKDLDPKSIKHGWFREKETGATLFAVNPDFYKSFDPENIDWTSLIQSAKASIPEKGITSIKKGEFDRLVYTDTHIGLEPNKNDLSLYGGKWDREEALERADYIIRFVLDEQQSDVLVVDELGDFVDGYDGKTVRREHSLEQNMTNEEMFDVGLEFKLRILLGLYPHYNKIIFNNICEDNHAGSFGYMVNSAFKKYADTATKGVEVNNYRKFISHYQVKNRVFIISHGKDSKNLKFGFKAMIDNRAADHINNYIDEHFLHQPGVKIEFSKGDSHQLIFDDTSAERFGYYSYPALSPASNWVQTNFKKGKSGFVFFNYLEDRRRDHKQFFEWKK